MDVSKQMTFTLACAAVLSVVIPGTAGYFSARMDAVEAAELNLRVIQTRLQAAETRPVSLTQPCEVAPPVTNEQPPPAAFVPAPEERQHRKREQRPVVPPAEWPISPEGESAAD